MSAQDKQTGAPEGAPTSEEHLALIGEFDAAKWANVFARQFPGFDEGTAHSWFACAIMAGYDHKANEQRRLVRELDVALNGEAGAAPQAALCDLVAQVQRQQAVRVLKLADGMRINFRAPDGRRGTLHLSRVLRDVELGAMIRFDENVPGIMRAAIDAYPTAGEPPLPEIHSDAHDTAQAQALATDPDHYA